MVQMILTAAQLDAVNAKGEHVLVKGIPGSGKTTVLIAKVTKILNENPTANILFITYNRTLKNYLDQSFKQRGLVGNLTVSTYHAWANAVLKKVNKSMYTNPSMISDTYKTIYNVLKETSSHRFYKNSKYKSFLLEEVSWIKGKGIDKRKDYLKVKRVGRGQGLIQEDREVVYDYLEMTDIRLENSRLVSFDDYANKVDEYMDTIIDKTNYEFVFIDEGQDLSEMQLITLRKVVRKELYVAADLGQKIYKTDFTWKSVGIQVQGGRTKNLKSAHRSTQEIMNLANSLIKNDELLKREEGKLKYEANASGDKPILCKISSGENEFNTVAQTVKEVFDEFDKDVVIGVLADTGKKCFALRNIIVANGVPAEVIEGNKGSVMTPGVKLITMHGAKGLEFDVVIIIGLDEKYPSMKYCSEEVIHEQIEIGRRLLYVSMTRAKEVLFLTYKGNPSQYIGEMDKTLYEVEEY